MQVLPGKTSSLWDSLVSFQPFPIEKLPAKAFEFWMVTAEDSCSTLCCTRSRPSGHKPPWRPSHPCPLSLPQLSTQQLSCENACMHLRQHLADYGKQNHPMGTGWSNDPLPTVLKRVRPSCCAWLCATQLDASCLSCCRLIAIFGSSELPKFGIRYRTSCGGCSRCLIW